MTSSLKRPWFRFHLLTALLMMAVAGGAIGASCLPSKRFYYKGGSHLYNTLEIVYSYGWPCDALSVLFPISLNDAEAKEFRERINGDVHNSDGLNGDFRNRIILDEYEKRFSPAESFKMWSPTGFTCDIATLFTVLIAIAVLCEYFIRRFKGCKR